MLLYVSPRCSAQTVFIDDLRQEQMRRLHITSSARRPGIPTYKLPDRRRVARHSQATTLNNGQTILTQHPLNDSPGRVSFVQR